MILAVCLALFLTPSIAYALFGLVSKIRRRRADKPRVPWIGPWRVRCICTIDPSLTRWLVSRRVGDGLIENLYYPPPGYRDSSVLASFKTRREAYRAAKKANCAKE